MGIIEQVYVRVEIIGTEQGPSGRFIVTPLQDGQEGDENLAAHFDFTAKYVLDSDFYTNWSHPNGDEVTIGHQLLVLLADLRTLKTRYSRVAAFERIIYRGSSGAMGITDVMSEEMLDDDPLFTGIWDNTFGQVEATNFDDKSKDWQVNETARRVAACYAIMAFGTETILAL